MQNGFSNFQLLSTRWNSPNTAWEQLIQSGTRKLGCSVGFSIGLLGTNLFNVVVDSLHRYTQFPHVGFANNFKFVYDVIINDQATGQAEIYAVCNWSDEFCMPLSLEKYVVLHFGSHQKHYNIHRAW